MDEVNIQEIECIRAAIDVAIHELRDAVRQNNRLPEELKDNSVTLITVPHNSEAIIIDGSSHKLREHFIALFKARPELRAMVSSVLDEMFRIDNR